MPPEQGSGCPAELSPEVAAALELLRATDTLPPGVPDLTGLAVRVVQTLEGPQGEGPQGTDGDEGLFARAFQAWAGVSPTAFVAAVRYLWAACAERGAPLTRNC